MERRAVLCLLFSGMLWISGCTAGSFVSSATQSQSAAVSSVAFSCSPTTLVAGQTSQCSATVSGTGSYSQDVSWSAATGTITSSGLYTAPATAPSSGLDTVTAVSKQDIKKSASGSLKIASPSGSISSVVTNATPSAIMLGQTSTCTATVSGKGSFSTAVTWAATGGTITQSGVFTPASIGNGTCTATSVQDTSQSSSASIGVASMGPTVTGVTLVCTPTSITTAQTATCTPTVTGSGAFSDTVNLSISPSGAGTLSSSTGVASGTSVTFTPPGTAGTATITATSMQDSSKISSTTVAVTSTSGGPVCSGLSLGSMGSLNGFVPFPSTNAWNTDISSAPLDSNNSTIVAAYTGNHLHPDFSSVAGGNYGIPYTVVDSSTQAVVPISVTNYPTESDVAYAPYPSAVQIEGAPSDCTSNGDQHVIVIDRNSCMMYETFATIRCNGSFSADSETIWDLKNYEKRPYGWTSADAAGLPIFPGLVRYDEIASGAINHALRFTLNNTKNDANGGYFVSPATHAAGTVYSSPYVIGMRIRLKAGFDISGFSATNQIILRAMKKYGLILADNGSNFYFQGTPDARWNDSDLAKLGTVTSDNFEVVQMTPSYPGLDAATAPTGATPIIDSFTASASTVSAGTPVTLTWSASNDSYDFIDKLGGVRGPSVTVTPRATTTYTLNATNQYGRTTKQVTVVVQ